MNRVNVCEIDVNESLPLHVLPSTFSKELLRQEQTNDPKVLEQISEQPPFPVKHSLISKKYNIVSIIIRSLHLCQ